MRNFIHVIILIGLISCDSKQEGIEINPNLVEPFFIYYHLFPENPKFQYSEVERHLIDLNNNKKLDTIKLRQLTDWNDPGDFHQIEIILDNNKSVIETEFGGWVKFGNNYSVEEELKEMNQINSELILITNLNPNQKIVLTFGWVYASQPGLVSIFEGNGIKPQLIFNKNFDIYKIRENKFIGIFEFRDHIERTELIDTVRLINNRLEVK